MRALEAAVLLSLAACGGQVLDIPDASDVPDASGVPDGSDDVTCAAPKLTCNGTCVDPQTDNANCGGCGLVCTTTCTSGRCVETLTAASKPTILATDGKTVFWSSYEHPSVLASVPVGGGTTTTIVDADPSQIVDGPLRDDASVYWLTMNGVTGSISSVPLGGGKPAPLVSGTLGEPLTVAGGLFYVAYVQINGEWYVAIGTSAKSGGPILPVDLLGPSNMGGPYAIAADATTLFLATMGEGSAVSTLATVPIFAGNTIPSTLVDVQGHVDALVLDPTHVYYAVDDAGAGALMRIDKTGGAPLTLAAFDAISSDPFTSANVALDATSIYFTAPGDGTVAKVPLGGGPVTVLASGQQFPRNTNGRGIAVDATSVYWSTDTAIMKVTPK